VRHILVALAIVALAVSPVWADMSNLLSPVGSPQFSDSITQSGWAPVTMWSQYVGLRVVGPSEAFIEKVTGLANGVAGTLQYDSTGRLTEGWWVNAAPPSFSATYELESLLGSAAAQNPESYVGLRIETALAGSDGQITLSRSWVFTNGQSPSQVLGAGNSWLPISIGGWYLSDIALDGSNWSGGEIITAGPNSAVPTPGAAVLGLIGLGLIGWLKRQTA